MATPGDAREDHAQASASLVQAEYANAELMIIAAIAYCARKLAVGSMTRQGALAYLRRSLLHSLAGVAPRVRAMIANHEKVVRSAKLASAANSWAARAEHEHAMAAADLRLILAAPPPSVEG